MQTQTHRADACTPAVLQAAVKKALTSAAFGQFMTGVVLNAVAEASAAPQGIVLAAPKPSRVRWLDDLGNGIRAYQVIDDDGNVICAMQTCCEPGTYTPSWIWYGTERRVDEQGRRWTRDLGRRVFNDFGDLVEVYA